MKNASIDIEIKSLTEQREGQWDEFVLAHPKARFSSLIGYKKAIEQSFGYKARYFIFEQNNEIKAVFPCFLVQGNLISIPFGVYGGVLAKDLSKQEISDAMREIKKLYPKIKIAGEKQDFDGLFSKTPYKYGVLRLVKKESLWNNKLNRTARKNIKRAEKSGLKAFQDNSGQAIKKHFYPLYCKEMKRFGTPPYGLKFFNNLLKNFQNKARVLYVKDKNGKIISSLFGIGVNEYFYILFSPWNPKYNFCRPNDLVHWEMINKAFDDGYKYFDFGSMKYEGQIRFKEKWGVEQRDYYIYSSDSKDLEGKGNALPVLAKIWKILMPNFLAKKVGHNIRKKLAK